jgi:hypothetical protein
MKIRKQQFPKRKAYANPPEYSGSELEAGTSMMEKMPVDVIRIIVSGSNSPPPPPPIDSSEFSSAASSENSNYAARLRQCSKTLKNLVDSAITREQAVVVSAPAVVKEPILYRDGLAIFSKRLVLQPRTLDAKTALVLTCLEDYACNHEILQGAWRIAMPELGLDNRVYELINKKLQWHRRGSTTKKRGNYIGNMFHFLLNMAEPLLPYNRFEEVVREANISYDILVKMVDAYSIIRSKSSSGSSISSGKAEERSAINSSWLKLADMRGRLTFAREIVEHCNLVELICYGRSLRDQVIDKPYGVLFKDLFCGALLKQKRSTLDCLYTWAEENNNAIQIKHAQQYFIAYARGMVWFVSKFTEKFESAIESFNNNGFDSNEDETCLLFARSAFAITLRLGQACLKMQMENQVDFVKFYEEGYAKCEKRTGGGFPDPSTASKYAFFAQRADLLRMTNDPMCCTYIDELNRHLELGWNTLAVQRCAERGWRRMGHLFM